MGGGGEQGNQDQGRRHDRSKVMRFKDGGRVLSQGAHVSSRSWKRKRILPWSLQKEHGSANTRTLAQGDPGQPSDLKQNSHFVLVQTTAAGGNRRLVLTLPRAAPPGQAGQLGDKDLQGKKLGPERSRSSPQATQQVVAHPRFEPPLCL